MRGGVVRVGHDVTVPFAPVPHCVVAACDPTCPPQMYPGSTGSFPVVHNTTCAADLRSNCNKTTALPLQYGLTGGR